MTCPLPCAIIPGSTARIAISGPMTFTSIARRHSSTSISHVGPTGPKAPALFTRMSIRPNAPRAASTTWRIESSSVTSAAIASARPPRSWTSAAVSSTSADVRAVTTTEAPASLNASAIARPIPRPPPVTIAIRPSSAPVSFSDIASVIVASCVWTTSGKAPDVKSRASEDLPYGVVKEANATRRSPMWQTASGPRSGAGRAGYSRHEAHEGVSARSPSQRMWWQSRPCSASPRAVRPRPACRLRCR